MNASQKNRAVAILAGFIIIVACINPILALVLFWLALLTSPLWPVFGLLSYLRRKIRKLF